MVRWCWVNFQCRGILLIWIRVGQGPTALAVGAGGGCLDIFSLVYHFSFLSPSLWETARYKLKYCLKGPLSPKQPTNQHNQTNQNHVTLVSSVIWHAINHCTFHCLYRRAVLNYGTVAGMFMFCRTCFSKMRYRRPVFRQSVRLSFRSQFTSTLAVKSIQMTYSLSTYFRFSFR